MDTRALIRIAGVLAMVLGAAVFVGARSEIAEVCMDNEAREQVRAIMLEGLKSGLTEHTKGVFDIWLRDPSDQPKRAIAGMRGGILAYVRSREAVLKFNPPTCGARHE